MITVSTAVGWYLVVLVKTYLIALVSIDAIFIEC